MGVMVNILSALTTTAPPKVKPSKTALKTADYSVSLVDVCRHLGLGASWGGGVNLERAWPSLEEAGLKKGDVGLHWTGAPGVSIETAARIVDGYHRVTAERNAEMQRRLEEQGQAQAEASDQAYIRYMEEKAKRAGWDSLDAYLDSLGFDSLEELEAAEREQQARRRSGLVQPGQRPAKSKAEIDRERMTPSQKAAAEKARDRAWKAAKASAAAETKAPESKK